MKIHRTATIAVWLACLLITSPYVDGLDAYGDVYPDAGGAMDRAFLAASGVRVDEAGNTTDAYTFAFKYHDALLDDPLQLKGIDDVQTTTYHDRLGAVTKSVDDLGREATSQIDYLGRIVQADSPKIGTTADSWSTVQTEFDEVDRAVWVKTTERDGTGAVRGEYLTATEYDCLDRPRRVIVRNATEGVMATTCGRGVAGRRRAS